MGDAATAASPFSCAPAPPTHLTCIANARKLVLLAEFCAEGGDEEGGGKREERRTGALKCDFRHVLFQRIWHKSGVQLGNSLLTGKWQRGLPKL